MKQKKAFTLIEILIAISIFGIITALLITNTQQIADSTANLKLTTRAYKTLQTVAGNYIAENGEIKSGEDVYTGTNFCEFFVNLSNISDTYNCNRTIAHDGYAAPNFILNNGMRFYNFGATAVHKDSTSIANLNSKKNLLEDKNTSLESKKETLAAKKEELATLVEGSDEYVALNELISNLESSISTLESEISTLKSEIAALSTYYYVVYVDIDGKNRKSQIDKDIVTFLINVNGEVLPSGVAATSKKYMLAGYKKLNDDGTWEWVAQNINAQKAICKSGFEIQTKTYCGAITVDPACETTQCRYIIKD